MIRATTIFITTLVAATPLTAQTCMNASEMEAALIDWYGEKPVGESNEPTQYWASAQTGTWSLVEYRADGTACVLKTGENWDSQPPSSDPALYAALER